jgi:S-adenosylmethionine:tRNA-ribosyltransferase-isomerase (queuine synthetase)
MVICGTQHEFCMVVKDLEVGDMLVFASKRGVPRRLATDKNSMLHVVELISGDVDNQLPSL